MPIIVALDLETTGLDPAQDAVIEIGAVKFNDTRVEAEYSTLINPRKPISAFITNLTGITNSMVMNAPLLINALPDLVNFIGDAPILGQNIGFDLAFLQKAGILRANPILDTYELASVLMPSAARYSLGALASQLGVLQPATHRALDDARATHAVYLELMNQLERLPIELVAEILRLSEGLGWNGELPFRWTLQKLTRQGIRPKKGSGEAGTLFASAKPPQTKPLVPVDTPKPLESEALAAALEPGGEFDRHFPGFEHRSQQVQMLRAVADAFSQQKHLMVEAGTGTGKSLAYLIPAAAWALQNGERVVISTNTIALQDQLVNKDIPDMIAALDLDINVSVLKGRNNYLCPRRLNLLRRRQPETVDELRVLAKVLVWLQSSDSGDRNEINLNGPVERSVWSRLSAEDEGCKLEVCLKRTGGRCPYYRARIAADSAHILIVNHALLLADAAANGRVLPEYRYLIVDEAHHLESATTEAMSFKLRAPDVTRLVRELGSAEQGVFGRLLAAAQSELNPSELAALTNAVEQATDLAFRLDNAISAYFRALENAMAEMQEGKPVSQYAQQERITESKRKAPFWFDVEVTWESAQVCLRDLLNAIKNIREGVRGLADSENEEVEDLLGILGTMSMNLLEIDTQLEGLTLKPDPNTIYWVEQDPLQHRLTLQAAPLDIGRLMEKTLWYSKESVILTSATLTTHGEFDYLRRRLNAEDADELTVGSPFDYENSALVYLARDIPEPKEAHPFQKAAEETLVRLAKATGGRMLALFTSYAQLQRTSRAIEGPLAKADITVYEQGEGASASALLDVFKETPRAVLLGTRAFWEGVDVPGEALSVLVITKLPFDVPSDPIVEARSESFDDPFNEYMLPEAILRFRQGFGRLIRTQTDRGVVAILDKRILSKQYGRLFMESLPDCTVIEGSLANLPEKAASWLGS
ncbi:MAG: DEAD/DEAH box helicase [Chloroflexi bacterium]|nr:DEAD/DEAH box helicase [Anaerolineaceae bacterium]NLI45277.1 DEAD/DEAH box helicase [Chloroflexota bacterium]HOE34816.1 helicase C-terminal domain-containing protein [Anaerolineaceae bacterium]HOT25283.1 helicase C-terminal domain-containing protein [Anaerolineaceae bacterium]HQK02867.1 helicase C-terminal domain-containing protein [Anaerolineaceae bacterium]